MKIPYGFTPALAVLMLAMLGGCAKHTPATEQADIAKAQAAGDRNVAAARNTATEQMIDARKELAEKQDDVAHASAVAGRNVTVAEAEATHKVALERCDALSGDEESHCKSLADSELKAAKANADATKVSRDPKG